MCVHMELEWMEQLSKSWTGLLIFMYLYQMPFPLAQMAGGGAFPLSSKLINQSCHIDSKKFCFHLYFIWDKDYPFLGTSCAVGVLVPSSSLALEMQVTSVLYNPQLYETTA